MDSERLQLKNRIVENNKLDVKIVSFKSQNYDTLRNECIIYNRLFEDTLFSIEEKSVFYTKPLSEGVVWKRPKDLCENPYFLAREPIITDFDQGILENASLAFGCSSIVLRPELFEFIIPTSQNFDHPNYCGIFHFRFWYYGRWVDVVIDDRLPVDSNNQPIFGRNKIITSEFWFPLLEKAYAKICGCYEILQTISPCDMLIDLTGAIVESFDIKNFKNENSKNLFWKFLKKLNEQNNLIRAYMAPNPKIKGVRLANGLAVNRYYTVCAMTTISEENKMINLIKIKNQWDEKVDWRLPWSEKADSLIKKYRIDQFDLNKGEFWMKFDDFYQYFETIQICEFTSDAFFLDTKKLNLISFHGEWVPKKSSGGSGRVYETEYWKNPQLIFTLNDKMNTVVISLYQKYYKELNIEKGTDYRKPYIQFRLYKIIDENDAIEAKKNCSRLYANQLEKCATSGCYINKNDVTRRFKLAYGSYVLVSSCYDKDVKQEFLVRVCTENSITESVILEEFKALLEKEEVIFSMNKSFNNFSNGKKKFDSEGFGSSLTSVSVKEFKFYENDSVSRENDKIDVNKKNKYFD